MSLDPLTTAAYGLPACRYCGGCHTGMCPRVKAIDYHPNGSVRRVELWGRTPAAEAGLNQDGSGVRERGET